MGCSLSGSDEFNHVHMMTHPHPGKSRLSFLLGMALLIAACQTAVEPVEEASRICACLSPIDSLNQQLVLALDQGLQDEALELMQDLNQQTRPVADCLERGLPKDMTNWPTPELRLELTNQCPAWETMLQSLSGYTE